MMSTEPDKKDHQEQPARRPYERPHMRVIELLPEETLGIGCKTAAEVACQSGFGFGS